MVPALFVGAIVGASLIALARPTGSCLGPQRSRRGHLLADLEGARIALAKPEIIAASQALKAYPLPVRLLIPA